MHSRRSVDRDEDVPSAPTPAPPRHPPGATDLGGPHVDDDVRRLHPATPGRPAQHAAPRRARTRRGRARSRPDRSGPGRARPRPAGALDQPLRLLAEDGTRRPDAQLDPICGRRPEKLVALLRHDRDPGARRRAVALQRQGELNWRRCAVRRRRRSASPAPCRRPTSSSPPTRERHRLVPRREPPRCSSARHRPVRLGPLRPPHGHPAGHHRRADPPRRRPRDGHQRPRRDRSPWPASVTAR